MDQGQIYTLITRGENEKLDFKKQWYAESQHNKQELAKDIIGLANGNSFHVGETAYLIFGVSEGRGGNIDLHSVQLEREISVLQREVTQQVNSYAEPPITKISCELCKYNGFDLLIISIPQHPYVITLKKDLRLPTYRRGDVLYRIGESTEVAGFDERKLLEEKVKKLQSTTVEPKLSLSENEIKIDAESILRLVVSKRDFRTLSSDEGHKNNDGIFYIYYYYSDGIVNRGFMFLGNRIVNKRVFSHFFDRFGSCLPKSLEIFLAKKIVDGHVVDKKRDILKLCDSHNMSGIVGSNIHYIDEFIWDYTLSETSIPSAHKRSDFIDQNLYDHSTNDCLGVCIEYFISEITNLAHPISIITGSGGVGKSTFCDALQYTINAKNIRKKIFYIRGEKVAQFLSGYDKTINSLEDIYDLYKSETEFQYLNVDDFKLNYISGNIVVIIDAIDEIDSALGDRFNLSQFLYSLQELNASFFSTKIILTTRGNLEKPSIMR